MSYRAGVPEYLKGQLYKNGGEVKKHRPKYYHGTHKPELLQAIMDSGSFSRPLHLTPDRNVAQNYGGHIMEFDFPEEPRGHIGSINKDGNMNKNVGTGIEMLIPPAELNRLLKDW